MPQLRLSTRMGATAITLAVIVAAVSVGGMAGPSVPTPNHAANPAPRQWPMFGGTPQRNMVNPFEKNLPATWSVEDGKRKNIKWTVALGSKAYGVPVIAGGRVFVGTNNENPREKKWDVIDPRTGKLIDLGVLMCFRESDGKFLWQAVHEKLPGGQVVDWPREGLCSAPVVEGERLYYVSNRGELTCAGVADGKAIWTLDIIKELGVFPHNCSACSPLIVDDLVMVVTGNGVDGDHTNIPAPQAPSFIAVHKRTGKVVWQDNTPTAKFVGVKQDKQKFRELVNRGEMVAHAQWSSPASAVVNGKPQVIFLGGDGWIYAFDPRGKLIWKFDGNPKDAKYELSAKGTRNDFIAAPVIYKNRVYIGMGQDPEHERGVGHLWCIDMTKKGDVSPELVTDATVFPPKTKKNPNSAVVWHYGGAITDPVERKKKNRNYYFGRTMSTCAIHDGLLYIAELSGWMHCLDADTGVLQWTHDTDGAIWSSPYYADGKVFLGGDGKAVFVFEHGRKKKLLAEIEMEGRMRGIPVACNGVLYITPENRLYAIAQDK